jgi:hypothetical protein
VEEQDMNTPAAISCCESKEWREDSAHGSQS